MCFRDSKQPEVWKAYGISKDNDDTLKIYATEWRKLTEKERADWDEVARNDKVRFVREKATYKGPYNIPKRRAKKNPLAPKRPMSAFLKYSQSRRAKVKEDNPDMSNTDVSRLLGEMWRNASKEEKAPYQEQEEIERAEYKEIIKKWRADYSKQAKQEAAARKMTNAKNKKSKKKGSSHALMEPPIMTTAHPNMLGSLDHLYKDPLLEDPHVSSSNKRSASAFRSSPHYTYHHHHHHQPPPPPPQQGYLSSPYRPGAASSSYLFDGYHPMPTWAPLPVDSMDQGDEATSDNNNGNKNNTSDPLPVVPTRMPVHPMSHDEFTASSGAAGQGSGTSGGQYPYRSTYFSEYMNMPPYSSRYNI
jgi:HMG (high mobility group) box